MVPVFHPALPVCPESQRQAGQRRGRTITHLAQWVKTPILRNSDEDDDFLQMHARVRLVQSGV